MLGVALFVAVCVLCRAFNDRMRRRARAAARLEAMRAEWAWREAPRR